jgi:hypothetical protein
MKLGSEEHKELFCGSFIASHLTYEPETLPWPDLDSVSLERLRGIPFWREAIRTEREAGMMVNAFAQTADDSLLKEAIALQGREESRHARLIEHLVQHYDIPIAELPPVEEPRDIKTAFIDFGFGECLDSFFAFGLFEIARQSHYFPDALLEIFDPVLDEEARHIMFFINWLTYAQIQQGRKANWQRDIYALWHYRAALLDKIQAFTGSQAEKEEQFTATGAGNFMDNLTPESFLYTCLKENDRRLSVFDSRLLQPRLMPNLAQIALRVLKLLPKRPSKSLTAVEN